MPVNGFPVIGDLFSQCMLTRSAPHVSYEDIHGIVNGNQSPYVSTSDPCHISHSNVLIFNSKWPDHGHPMGTRLSFITPTIFFLPVSVKNDLVWNTRLCRWSGLRYFNFIFIVEESENSKFGNAGPRQTHPKSIACTLSAKLCKVIENPFLEIIFTIFTDEWGSSWAIVHNIWCYPGSRYAGNSAGNPSSHRL